MIRVRERQGSLDDTSDGSEDTIVSRFERQAAAAPDKLAIVTDDISLTYRALALKAAKIAGALSSVGPQRTRPIVIFMPDEASRVAAILGVLKANRIFVPLASDSPEEWITKVIEDSGAGLIIVDASIRLVAERAAGDHVVVVELDELHFTPKQSVDETARPDDTAYIVYTSGSTGRPKGVANSHRRVVHNSDVRSAIFGLGRNDRYGNLASSVGSAGLTHTFLCLLAGGGLFPFDLRLHGLQQLAPWLVAQKITYISFFGSVLRTWLASLPDRSRFPDLKVVGANGERLYAEDVARIARHLDGDWRIGHCYSSTECGTIAAQTFGPSRLPDTDVVAVGPPVDGAEVSIQDETGRIVPAGEIGEIVVRSRFLAQGYWKNPDLTAKAFEADPLDANIRTYRTGDLGRWRSNGVLDHLGRRGRTIRLRGYSVEPFQVECELKRQSEVSDAAVLRYDGDNSEEPRLVGYVVAPASASSSAIRKALAERLPSYMVPSHIVVLDRFPIARSGKIDVAALPPPGGDEVRHVLFRAPSDEREHELLKIWKEVLKLSNIGLNDDFFELGGTSLQALMLFSEIEARLGCNLSPTTIVQAPTIAGLADFIRTRASADESQSLVPLRTGKGQPLFLVHNRYCFVMYYRHLLADLRSDRPVFGLQPPALDGTYRIPRTVEKMAVDYILEIRRVQPQGPYFLAAHSFGGLVSFEIARQLVQVGEKVRFLGLIDTILRNSPSAISLQESTRRSPLGQRLFAFFEKLKWIGEIAKQRWFVLKLSLGQPIPYDQRTDWYDWVCRRASSAYVPKPYDGHITMFSSAGNSNRQKASWSALANGGLTILEMPATHDDMVLPPDSKLLAEHFDDCLAKANAE